MKVSDIVKKIENISLFKEGEFNNLGMLTSRYKNSKYLSFLSDLKYLGDLISNKNVSVIITKKDYKEYIENLNIGVIFSDNPKQSFYNIHNFLLENKLYWDGFPRKIHSTSIISNKASIPNKNIFIGKNVIIEDYVTIKEGVIIGDNVIIRSGSVIGSVGFQYNIDETATFINSGGRVIIEDNVEINCNVTIDKAVFGDSTIIKKGVKIDSQVHIGHDCKIGENTLIVSGVHIGGRTKVGKKCWLGINSTISNGLEIGDNVKISLGSVVTTNVNDGSIVSGNFAIEHKKFIDFIKSIR